MLKDRLRTSAVLIAVAAALLALDALWAPQDGEGLFLIPLLLFFATGTAWDVAGMLRVVGARPGRRVCMAAVAIVGVSPIVPTVWNSISAASDGRLATYPTDCPIGRLGWPVLAFVASAFVCFLIQMGRYRPVSTQDVRQTSTLSSSGHLEDSDSSESVPRDRPAESKESKLKKSELKESESKEFSPDALPTNDSTFGKRGGSAAISERHVPSGLVSLMAGIFVVAYVGFPMCLLVATRTLGDGRWGLAALLTLIATTKSADAGAYFSGKSFGRRKLIPRLSPGKTWEGLIGGVLVATVVAAACIVWGFPWLAGPSTVSMPPVWLAVLLGPSLTIAGLIGDLGESMIKRECGAKDSGSWLPGLGGMWDVSDSLLAAALPGYLCFVAMT